MKILFASGNSYKKNELNKILKDHELVLPKEIGIEMDVEETGLTYQENALLKAKELYKMSGGLPVLADDSGISVDALDGAPGIYSARYGDEEAGRVLSSQEKNALLLKNMKNKKSRKAAFICCMAFILDDHRFFTIQEAFEGEVAMKPYGKGGFGYDPVFYLPEYGMTAAELDEDEKNRISHRGKAGITLNKLLEIYG